MGRCRSFLFFFIYFILMVQRFFCRFLAGEEIFYGSVVGVYNVPPVQIPPVQGMD